jgi:arsenate reductase (thioredoxin)
MDRKFNVLFICTSNSGRSIIAEAVLRSMSGTPFNAYSAGSHPKGSVNPFALEVLKKNRISTDGLRSKDWSEFAKPDSPTLDFVFTVCDKAAGEVCPVWPGQPLTAHWGVKSPSENANDDETLHEYAEITQILRRRIELLVALPVEKLDRLALQKELTHIGGIR